MKEYITSVCESNDISENIKSKIMTQMKKESICRNWARNECTNKQDCIYAHPVMCEDQIRKGYCNNKNCRLYHPKICWDNRSMEKCRRGTGCTYRHIHDENTIENEFRNRRWNNTRNYEKHQSQRNETRTRERNDAGDYERRHSQGRTHRREMNDRENDFL